MIIKNLAPEKNDFHVIGMMSGTSLDGMDLCYTHFKLNNNRWSFEIKHSTTIHYAPEWEEKLKNCRFLSGEELTALDIEFGHLTGKFILEFIQEHQIDQVDLIASHGHTVFHQPENKFTLQIGNGEAIACSTNLPVVNDFRQKDVQLGGQGAPLVPIGDLYLFPDYQACLNLGGIANISIKNGDKIEAFDICPMNLSLNKIAEKIQLKYDPSGQNAAQGKCIPELLEQLNHLPFYTIDGPKSLGIEWLDNNIFNLIESSNAHPNDLLRTFCEHQTTQIAKVVNERSIGKTLITGGGAWNTFFIETLRSKCQSDILLPSKEIIEFKEALIFGFLGVLHLKGIPNVLSMVTGSSRNSVSGVLHLPY
ncbi:MAG: anhydro-N-acetylmuramic acid kinase [Crocinitomicaceae bacterium]